MASVIPGDAGVCVLLYASRSLRPKANRIMARSSLPSPLGISLAWWMRIGLIGCAIALLALNLAIRRAPTGPDPDEPLDDVEVVTLDSLPDPLSPENDATEPSLVNDGWYVRNMATAHGAFVIEVEAEDPSQTDAIARALIEPIQDDYAEILVYVNRIGDNSDLPARRMQWTPRDGYVELNYASSRSDER